MEKNNQNKRGIGKRVMGKRAMMQAKAYFIIANMLIAMFAFAIMLNVGGVSGGLTETNLDDTSTDTLTLGQVLGLGSGLQLANKAVVPPSTTIPSTVGVTSSLQKPAEEVNKAIQLYTKSNVLNVPEGVKLYSSGSTTPITQLIKNPSDGTFHLIKADGTMGDAVSIPSGVDTSEFTSVSDVLTSTYSDPVKSENILGKLLSLDKGGFADSIVSGATWALGSYFAVKMVADMLGVSKTTSDALALSAAAGLGVYNLFKTAGLAGKEGNAASNWIAKTFGSTAKEGLWSKYNPITSPGLWGIGAAAVVFVLMYKKTDTQIVEFNCQPYEPPIGGADCELCNENENGCTEYRCKSLGQACGIIPGNDGNDVCAWLNPRDVNSPLIKVNEVSRGLIWKKDGAVRPPATGVVISQENGDCIEPFTPLEFALVTDEPSQCKVDYNLTKGYDEMSYYLGGLQGFSYNHTETMSLPGPDAINAIAPELKNDGTYTVYVRCVDGNGNFNQDAFSVRFCVKPGPDATPPRIVDVSIPSKSPILFNQTDLNIGVYVNEPSECKWSREDRSFETMENSMTCSTNLWEMNNNNVYTCLTTLTGIKDRVENNFYFRCKDQPNAEEGSRNVNSQSYKYTIFGTQPLNILSVGPNETIRGSTGTIPIELTVKTDNGYDNGKAACYYYNDANNNAPTSDEDYILFADTSSNIHSQNQDLLTGSYTYYFKCVDLGGNTAYDSTTFSVESDNSAPTIVRVYREGSLKIITNEKTICSYSNKDCNFNIEDGIAMPYDNQEAHTAEWSLKNYYIRCKDEYDNQPNPNTCSMIVKPYNLLESVIEL